VASSDTSAEEIIKGQKNFLAFGAGAVIADKSSESEFKPARKLIDEARSEEWFSAEGQTANQFVTIELPARTILKTIIFDNNGFDYENRFAREVTVEISDVSMKDGFQKILEASLEKDKAGQTFPVSSSAANSLEKNGRAVIYGINFDFNSDVIKPESRHTLEKITTLLNEHPIWRLTIEGHTDNIGGASFNQTLSEKRAAAVKKYLTNSGIEESRLNTMGMGVSQPVASNETEVGRAQNRRVELAKQ
jgi:outer membrane protein OmpA-like peptidoglycan-associated protein